MVAAPPPAEAPFDWRFALVGTAVCAGLGLAITKALHPPSEFALFENAALRATLLGIPLALWAGRRELAALAAPPSRRHALLLAAIVVIGAAARFSIRPLPFHNNNWMDDFVGRVASEPEPAWYANGFGVFLRVFRVFGASSEDAIFTGNRVAGLLAPLTLYAVDRALFADPRKALWSALLLAIEPIHVRMSASETMQIIPSLFVLVALLGFRAHAATGSRALCAAGVLAFGYAVLSRAEYATAAVALPLLYAPRADRSRAADPALWAMAGLAAIVGLPMLTEGMYNDHAVLVAPGVAIAQARSALEYAGSPAAAGTLLGLAGLALLAARGRVGAVAVLLAFAAAVEVAGFEPLLANRQQLLVPGRALLMLGASAIPAMACAALGAWRRDRPLLPAMAAAPFVAVAALAAWRAPLLRSTWDQQDEWIFQHDQRALLAGLDPAVPLVRFGRSDTDDGMIPTLPLYLVPPGVRVASVGDLLAGRVKPPLVYYRGTSCFAGGVLKEMPLPGRVHAPDAPSIRANCAEVERRFRLEPIAVTTIASPPFTMDRLGDTAEIGFYRVR